MPGPAPTRQQDTAKAMDHSARTAAIGRALGTLKPEHLYLALEALGLQHLKSLAGQVDQGLAGMQPGEPQPGQQPAEPTNPLPAGKPSPEAMRNETNTYTALLNQNLPDRQLQSQALNSQAIQQAMEQEKNQQLMNFLAGMQGIGFNQQDRAMLSPNSTLSPLHGTGLHY